jgi:AcrR family transcriptional regulator
MSSSADPRETPGRPSREETQQRLLDAAYQTFCEVGFQATTIEAVCSRAGFTRGAFYSNFTSLDELLLALWERTIDITVAAIQEQVTIVDREGHPFEQAIESLIAMRAPDRAWFVLSTEFLLHSLRTPGLQERVERHRARFREELRRGVAELLAAQGRRPPAGIDVDTFTQLLIAGHLGCQHVNATGTGDLELPLAMLRALVAGCEVVDDAVDLTGR